MLLSLKQWFLAPLRRAVQTVSLLLLHSSWGPELKSFCLPVMNCHSCALSWFACPIGVYVHYAGYRLFPFLAVGTVLIIGVFLGRFLCGWVCPFGFLQDLLHKIPSPKFRLPRWTAAIKYVVLVVMADHDRVQDRPGFPAALDDLLEASLFLRVGRSGIDPI